MMNTDKWQLLFIERFFYVWPCTKLVAFVTSLLFPRGQMRNLSLERFVVAPGLTQLDVMESELDSGLPGCS